MMKLVLAYYHEGCEALAGGADIEALVNMAVREEIGRFKYTPETDVKPAYEKVLAELKAEMESLLAKEED